jgi:ribosomal protein L11 methyltransferase
MLLRMQWIECRWILDPARVDEATERLIANDFTAFACSSRSDGAIELAAYSAEVPPTAAIHCLAELGLHPVAEGVLDEAELYRQHHPEAPVALTPSVWVLPTPEAVAPPGALGLRLPPGPAWGDGRHPTTRLCAQRVAARRFDDQHVLDLGCGTGLLGVLAAKRGARVVDFADLDPHSLRITTMCCTANDVAPRIYEGDLLAAVPTTAVYDVIIANLWADLVLALAADPHLSNALPNGVLIISGVNMGRRDEVLAALTNLGFTLDWDAEDAWWWGAELHR